MTVSLATNAASISDIVWFPAAFILVFDGDAARAHGTNQ